MARKRGGSNINDLLSIGRPARSEVEVDIGRDITDALASHVINNDQTMRLPVGDEGDLFSVGRPLRAVFIAAQFSELVGRLVAGDRRHHQVMLRHPHRRLAVGRELDIGAVLLLAAHVAEKARLASGEIDGPYLLLRPLQISRRIGDVSFAPDLRSARVDDGLAAGSQPDAENLLAVVALIRSNLMRLKL